MMAAGLAIRVEAGEAEIVGEPYLREYAGRVGSEEGKVKGEKV